MARCGTPTINQTESISGNESADWNSRQMKMTGDGEESDRRDGLPAEEEEEAAGGELINLKRSRKRNWGTKRGLIR